MGDLRSVLDSGEYGKLKECPLYESNFVQVTRYGEIANRVTVGIAASTPSLELPDLLLLARPVEYPKEECTCCNPVPKFVPREELQLTALMPLKFVHIFIHDKSRYQLKFRLANGREFYLQLLARPEELDYRFGQWVHLLYRLRFYQTDAPISFQLVHPNYVQEIIPGENRSEQPRKGRGGLWRFWPPFQKTSRKTSLVSQRD